MDDIGYCGKGMSVFFTKHNFGFIFDKFSFGGAGSVYNTK